MSFSVAKGDAEAQWLSETSQSRWYYHIDLKKENFLLCAQREMKIRSVPV